MNITTLARRLLVGAAATALLAALATTPASASDLVADSGSNGVLVTAAGAPAQSAPRSGAHAAASLPRGIVVTQHGGRPVTLFAEGQTPIRKARPGHSPATFTGLTAGTAYTVMVGGKSLGRVTALDRPAPATRLLVHAPGPVGAVTLTWQYRGKASTGGRAVAFDLTATSPGGAPVTTRVSDTRSASLTGLDPSALYTFSVTPVNTAGKGRALAARMSKSLAQLGGSGTASVPVPVTPTAPVPVPAPAPTPTPSTRTIYVCPAGFPENSSGTCTKTLPYTFSTLAYTYHQQATGPAPMIASYETAVRACPTGYSLEDYGWVMYCRAYGPVPTTTVKDATPAGYTDNGTAWVRKDAAPPGFTDDGSAWVRTVPKEAVVVPA